MTDRNTAMVMVGPGEAPVPEDREIPDPGPGEVLVRVRASSLNYHDLVNLSGIIPGPWPRVPMTDGAGEVVAVGSGVRGLGTGDAVIGAFLPLWLDGRPTRANLWRVAGDSEDGWLQHFKVFPASALVPAPSHLAAVEAATLPCAGVTAWSALRTADVKAGDTVVTLGTGGVSTFTVQLAKALGATVVVTSSSDDKLRTMADLGADHCLNYVKTPDWHRAVIDITHRRGADLVVDLGGAETLGRSIEATRMDGTVAVVGVLSGFGAAEIPVPLVMTRHIRLHGITVGSVAALRDLCSAVAANDIRPHVCRSFPWTDLSEATAFHGAGGHTGKIGLEVG